MGTQSVFFRDLGLMDYKTAWDYQESLLQDNVKRKSAARQLAAISVGPVVLAQTPNPQLPRHPEQGEEHHLPLSTQHYLLFVEHPAVYTLGKSGNIGNVLLSEENLKARGIDFFHTNRGGDITFHGPQQIVGYPILDLEKFYTDIGKYLRNLEEMIIVTLNE